MRSNELTEHADWRHLNVEPGDLLPGAALREEDLQERVVRLAADRGRVTDADVRRVCGLGRAAAMRAAVWCSRDRRQSWAKRRSRKPGRLFDHAECTQYQAGVDQDLWTLLMAVAVPILFWQSSKAS